ncbi:MAG: histidinol dehydrogenase [Methanohalophilus sp.]|nr:MAG: histidinol dehydrogenase [Methanohalophilus sp.]
MLYKKIKDLTNNELNNLMERASDLMAVKDTVETILADVKKDGDSALRYYTEKFDKARIGAIEVTEDEINEAMTKVDPSLLKHLDKAASNIRKFHEAQLPRDKWFVEISPGIKAGQKTVPLRSVGAYVPGGRASYPSTALMAIIPAKVAGVKDVAMCTPPGPDGKVNPLTLASAKVAGADRIYRLGGVQAVAALAYGTTSEEIAANTQQRLGELADTTPRSEIVKEALQNAAILIGDSLDECIGLSNRFGPEHLEIVTADDETVLDRIDSAGSIFMGKYAPVSTGDYASGTNHVLPTAGYTRLYSGLNINHFLKYSTIQQLDRKGLQSLSDTIITLAEEEGLYAHADAVRLRLKKN